MKFVFDFGAVLFSWQPARLLQRTLPHHAADEGAARRLVDAIFQGYGGEWGQFDRGTIEPGDLVQRIARRTGLSEADVQAVVDAVPGELAPIPDTVSLLTRLRDAQRPLYYLSNMPAPYADHLEREHDFVGWFDEGVFSARVKLAKPDAAIFHLAARRFGARPSELVFLDDHPANVEAARGAGWNAVQFTDAPAAEIELRRRGWWPA